ncbi:ABC-F family ATP-binding cassette domain-containing protein [uncultured Paludibaculum sp.]|uniref:ABC-F family ATP-binding cassette domain-containing protein n=1 Tax=uncultured Paludibaculum sp. TaxID=1765020 RepID=UPI002AABE7EE|nr:ABC-F family ATP-binding cassette domain-containing protein [uncultured Paludibaculum sp.]
MALLLNCQSIARQFGATTLFENVSLTISDGERHGMIGPNGAGKSTLLKVMAELEHADRGEVALRKGVRMTYVPQDPVFEPQKTVRQILDEAAFEPTLVPVALGQAGFTDPQARAGALSGGWRKRLAIAVAMVDRPDLMLLDEPTNHLDIEGIAWLERMLSNAPYACVVVSHDRYFLENVATHMMELNRVYPDGLFRVAGNYSSFLEKREQYFEAQSKHREALEIRVKREVEWLRRGAKARTRKSKARIDTANEMIAALDDLETRTRTAKAQIDFTASDRKTKKLIEVEGLEYGIGGRTLMRDLNFVLAPGRSLGLAGPNGSGKTTLLRLLLDHLKPTAGAIRRADNLRVVYFEQNRQQIDPTLTLRRALAPEGDSVIFNGRTIHVNGWAKQFLFKEDQLVQPVGSLSGGERARVHIARLMLEEADVLLLDEPTNDLDIPTLEVLEDSLAEFPGALVLVTHDRYLMDRVTNAVLGLDGEGGARIYADLSQWEAGLKEARQAKSTQAKAQSAPAEKPIEAASKKRLSYLDQREWDGMEQKILEAETALEQATTEMHAASTAGDARRLEASFQAMQQAQAEVDRLYARWAELEAKLSQ